MTEQILEKQAGKKYNWLVSGGCGFIGVSVVNRLLSCGHRVRILDNLSTGQLENLPAAEWHQIGSDRQQVDWNAPSYVIGNVTDQALVERSCSGADRIIHLAAESGVEPSVRDPIGTFEINVRGTLNLLQAAANNQVSKMIFASSGAALGDVCPPFHEQQAPNPISPYGASKLAGEAYLKAYGHTYGIDTVSLRFGNAYGPGSAHKTSVVASFIKSGLEGKPLCINGDGSHMRDFIYIDDLVEAIERAANARNVRGEVFQIACGEEYSIGDLARMVNELIVRRTGEGVKIEYGPARTGDMHRSVAIVDKARHLLGFEASTSLAQGLEQTLSYFIALNEKH